LLTVALAATAGVVILAAAAPETIPHRIVAREFVLVDGDGKERAALRMVHRDFTTVQTDGPQLILSDASAHPRLTLGFEEDSQGGEEIELKMLDTEGISQLTLKHDADGILGPESVVSIRGLRSQLYLMAKPGDARIQVKNHFARYASGVQIFSTPRTRGVEIERVEAGDERGDLLYPEIRLVREGGKTLVSLHGDDGNPVWSKP
jgi:hypothetical protein